MLSMNFNIHIKLEVVILSIPNYSTTTSAFAILGYKIEEIMVGSDSGPSPPHGIIQGLTLSVSNLCKLMYH